MAENGKELLELDYEFRKSYQPAISPDIDGAVYICNFVEMRPEEKFGFVVGHVSYLLHMHSCTDLNSDRKTTRWWLRIPA